MPDEQDDLTTWLRDMRAALDFIEQHPELGRPTQRGFSWWHYDWDGSLKPKLQAAAKEFRTFEKRFTEDTITLSKKLGTVELNVFGNRQGVCERRKVGTRKRITREPTAYIEREIEEPIYEYDCGSVLDPDVPVSE